MEYFVPRTCTEVGGSSDPRPIEELRDVGCCVLLGPPGAGKTEAFRKEAEREEKGLYISARRFIRSENAELAGKTLFIDGLDEIRAGKADPREPFDRVCEKLRNFGKPRFRLSCREDFWFGGNDRRHLEDAAPDGKVEVFRLCPLSREDIIEILRRNHGVPDPESFVFSAEQRGIYALLANPQSLSMLARARAAAGGRWPETRTETFDRACGKLLEEHNEEHSLADRCGCGIPGLLDAAGMLCALQLLAGSDGYSAGPNETDDGYINLKEIPGDQEIFLHALGSKLFQSSAEDCLAPVHRQVAEFLGGRYLAKRVREGLPFGRILSLMTGYDGGIHSSLRGLSAWLAAQSPQCREQISERVPLGVILHGDMRSFSASEKSRVLDRVARETEKNPWFVQALGYGFHLEYLATPDMLEYFQNALADPERSANRQAFVRFLLEILQRKSFLPELADVLMEIARDENCRPDIREYALLASVRHIKKDERETGRLRALLEDINSGSVSDPRDDLLGILLEELFPEFLPLSDLWRYLRARKDPYYYGSYAFFWLRHIPAAARLDKMLDGLCGHLCGLSAEKRATFFFEVFSRWLARFLETADADRVSVDRLSVWLWIVSGDEIKGAYESKDHIRLWLNGRPEIQKAVFEKWMGRGDASAKESGLRLFSDRGLRCSKPPDTGLWCLEHATEARDEETREFFLNKTARCMEYGVFNEGLSQEVAEEKLAGNPVMKQELSSLRYSFRRLLEEQELSARRWPAEERKELGKRMNYLRSQEEALRENRGSPYLLHSLASAYFGGRGTFSGDKPRDNLLDFLGGDEDLAETVLNAFRESLVRPDLPDGEEIIKIRRGNETHYLATPFLAGMEELFGKDCESVGVALPEKRKRQALAFYFNAPLPKRLLDSEPLWYRKLLASDPGTVSDVLTLSARSRALNSMGAVSDLYELVFRNHRPEATKLMILPLLETFPVRCAREQMRGLNCLLEKALADCEEETLLKLISKKLGYSSMNATQRVSWLAAGLVVSPPDFTEELKTYLTGSERRVESLRNFAKEWPNKLIRRLDVPSLELLARLIGYFTVFAWLSPEEMQRLLLQRGLVKSLRERGLPRLEEEIYAGQSTEARHLVYRLVEHLATVPSPKATEALERLLSDDGLSSWKEYLSDSLGRQKSVRREASFRHLDINQTIKILLDEEPANAAELSALTTEVLKDVAREIRHGNASGWRQYWNIENRRLSGPRDENLCREALLPALREKLKPFRVSAQPEGVYADDRRADIRVEYNGFSVPIEIKKSSSRDVWNAAKSQLIGKYARDPGADGHGIYLVFWFGGGKHCQPKSGTRPESAGEMEERLLKSLGRDQVRKISVCVIDVAEPECSPGPAN